MEVEIGLIDWEFASPVRIEQVIVRFSAWLYLFSTASAWRPAETRCRRTIKDTIVVTTLNTGLGQFETNSGAGIGHGIGVKGGEKHMAV